MTDPESRHFYVLKVQDFPALNYLAPGHAKPCGTNWINRGMDQILKPTSVDMLLRTLYQSHTSPSVARLHRSAGLRLVFGSETIRNSFAKQFAEARRIAEESRSSHVAAVFDERAQAERAIAQLAHAGAAENAISLLWRANRFLEAEPDWSDGHGKLSVAMAIAGGGLAGAALGVSFLLLPGVGSVAVAGALAAEAVPSVASVSAIFGATGGAIARMLSDKDVDDVATNYYEQNIRKGKIFIDVDSRSAGVEIDVIHNIISKNSGNMVIYDNSI